MFNHILAIMLMVIFFFVSPAISLFIFVVWLADCVLASQKAKKKELALLKKLVEKTEKEK